MTETLLALKISFFEKKNKKTKEHIFLSRLNPKSLKFFFVKNA
jgi:hypothetical protein